MLQKPLSFPTGVLREALPSRVAVAATEIGTPQPPLEEAELCATPAMSSQRLGEFVAGRACARAALRDLNLPAAGVPVGPNREPLWPRGVVGSISHSRRFAVAAVSRGDVLLAIGIDVEPAEPLDAELVSRVCRPEEIRRLGSGHEAGLLAKVIFSAKESVYKCLWPLTGIFLEFSDLEIVLNSTVDRFHVTGWGPLSGHPTTDIVGRVVTGADHVVAVAFISASPQSGNPMPGTSAAR